jgi:phospholipid/cholesterol/gamma-HCH transport system ATP-binding protein
MSMEIASREVRLGNNQAIISVRGLVVGFNEKIVLDHLNLDIRHGEILGVIGASGSGKSVLLRAIIGLVPKQQGTVEMFGENIDAISKERRRALERKWGVMFQHGALFSSLTVKQNIQFPMREYLELSDSLLDELAMMKIEMVGLKADAANKIPSELSGGMIKRAALARALALDPEIVFLDEPTSGLDPIGAGEFDQLIATLQKTLNFTVMMITHDLNSLHAVCNRVAAIAKGKVIEIGNIEEISASTDPWLKAYFQGERGRKLFGQFAPAHIANEI